MYICICICIAFFALTLCYTSFFFFLLYIVFIHVIVHVNERHKIRHYRGRSTEERTRRMLKLIAIFDFAARCLRKLALYSDVIHLFDWKSAVWDTMVVFKMRDSVPSARYSSVCNVLRQ